MAFCTAAGAFRGEGCSTGVEGPCLSGLTFPPPLHVSVFLYQQCSYSRGDLPELEEASGGSGRYSFQSDVEGAGFDIPEKIAVGTYLWGTRVDIMGV